MLKHIGGIITLFLMFPTSAICAIVYQKDGSTIECKSFWKNKSGVHVKVNESLIVDLQLDEVDIKKTFHKPVKNKATTKRVVSHSKVRDTKTVKQDYNQNYTARITQDSTPPPIKRSADQFLDTEVIAICGGIRPATGDKSISLRRFIQLSDEAFYKQGYQPGSWRSIDNNQRVYTIHKTDPVTFKTNEISFLFVLTSIESKKILLLSRVVTNGQDQNEGKIYDFWLERYQHLYPAS